MTNKGHDYFVYQGYESTYFGGVYPQNLPIRHHHLSSVGTNSPRDPVTHKILKVQNTYDLTRWNTIVEPNHVRFYYYGILFDYRVSQVENIRYDEKAHQEVLDIAATRLYGKISEVKVNLAQSLAEFNQTADLLENAAKTITSLFMAIRRKKPPKWVRRIRDPNIRAKAALDYAGSLWLQYTYGWVPLLADVFGVMKLQGEGARRPPQQRLHVKQKQNYTYEDVETSGEWVIRRNYSIVATANIHCRVKVADYATLKNHESGFDNPLLLAWEVLPYSFVADWFIPIGNFLESLTALTGLEVDEASTTVTAEQWVHMTVTPSSAVPTQYRSGYGPTFGSGYKKFKYRRLTIPAIPFPRFKNPLSFSHLASALSLLQQAFKDPHFKG